MPGCRYRSPRMHRLLLRAALELEGLRRRPPPQGQRDGRAALEVEPGKGRCRSSSMPPPAPRGSPTHPTCATRHMGLAGTLRTIAAELTDEVYVAPSATCCGFAGDRGISHPELTESATGPQAEELAGREFDAHLSSNRTCEIGIAEPRVRTTSPS